MGWLLAPSQSPRGSLPPLWELSCVGAPRLDSLKLQLLIQDCQDRRDLCLDSHTLWEGGCLSGFAGFCVHFKTLGL